MVVSGLFWVYFWRKLVVWAAITRGLALALQTKVNFVSKRRAYGREIKIPATTNMIAATKNHIEPSAGLGDGKTREWKQCESI